eukprot:8345205-Lingulodinium_polyedra.AAC.1
MFRVCNRSHYERASTQTGLRIIRTPCPRETVPPNIHVCGRLPNVGRPGNWRNDKRWGGTFAVALRGQKTKQHAF